MFDTCRCRHTGKEAKVIKQDSATEKGVKHVGTYMLYMFMYTTCSYSIINYYEES